MFINIINFNYLANAILGYIALTWYILYVFGIFTYLSPKFILTIIFILNLFYLIYYLSSSYNININLSNKYKTTININIQKRKEKDNIDIIKLILINIVLKLLPIISLHKEKYRNIDIVFSLFLIGIYYIFIYLLYRKILGVSDIKDSLNSSSDINVFIYDNIFSNFLSK